MHLYKREQMYSAALTLPIRSLIAKEGCQSLASPLVTPSKYLNSIGVKLNEDK